MFYIKLTILNDFSLEEVPVSPTGRIKKVLTVSMLQIVI